MDAQLKVGVVQMCSGTTHAGNIETVKDGVLEAVGKGAQLIALPEVAGLMNRNAAVARQSITAAKDDVFIKLCQSLGRNNNVWIHLGSTPVLAPDGRFLNQSALINPSGEICARYTKIHLFDAHVEGHKPIQESKRFAPGDEAVLAETPWGHWGLSICYDLRFPHLYRDYAKAGASLIFAPSAFTMPTGEAHWELLLRARAVDTGAFIIAAAQAGLHEDGRESWGHSMIVDPWGRVLMDLGRKAPRVEMLELDLSEVGKARAQVPSLANERPYSKSWVW